MGLFYTELYETFEEKKIFPDKKRKLTLIITPHKLCFENDVLEDYLFEFEDTDIKGRFMDLSKIRIESGRPKKKHIFFLEKIITKLTTN